MSTTTLVIGGGAAGVMLARRLSRSGGDVILVDPSADPGAGVAYGTAAPWHLLNSPAATMSVDSEDAGHFMTWADRAGSPIGAGDFAPRPLYGRYLRAVLAEALSDHGDRVRLVTGTVAELRPGRDGVTARLTDGGVLTADHAIIATGNPASQHPLPGLADHPRYVPTPWHHSEPLRDLPGPVLLIGTGLTAVDVALSVAVGERADPITAISRHGLVPAGHRRPDEVAAVQTRTPEPDRSLARLTAEVRRSVGDTGDWRAVVDGLRPRVDRLWEGLSDEGRERFLAHLARVWEVHRHRMAPHVAARFHRLRDTGRLDLRADRITAVHAGDPGHIGVEFASGVSGRYGTIVNCTGPGRLPGSANPLVARLLADGVAAIGPFRLGLDVDGNGRLVGADGRVHERLWTIGALRRGRLWETTAVPEIRAQADRIAGALAGSVARA